MVEGLQIFSRLILPVFLMLAAGFVVEKRMNLDLRTLSKISLYLFVPCLAFTKIYRPTVPLELLGIAMGFTSLMIVVSLLLGWGFSRILRQPRSMCIAYGVTAAFYNSGNYGLPLVEIVFHNDPYPVALQTMVVAAQNLFTFTVGLALLAGGKRTPRESLRVTLQYPFLYVLFAAIVLRVEHWAVPDPVVVALDHFADAVVPVALITLGAQLARISFARDLRHVIVANALRLVGGPLLAYLFIVGFHLHGILAQLLFISSGVPTAVNITILAIEYDIEPEFISQTTFWGTVLSSVSMTAVVYLALTAIH